MTRLYVEPEIATIPNHIHNPIHIMPTQISRYSTQYNSCPLLHARWNGGGLFHTSVSVLCM